MNKCDTIDRVPTPEMIRAFLAAALLCGEEFSSAEYEALSEQYAGGYDWFGYRFGFIEDLGPHKGWAVTEKGRAFLLGEEA